MSATKPFAIDKWLVYEAYQAVKANAGSAGVDKESIGDFEKDLGVALLSHGFSAITQPT
jgi:retron-type reverse transcriptase